MSAYEPPTEIDPIFNSLAFQTPNNETLTLAEADERYLARQNVATSVASATSFTGDITAPNFIGVASDANEVLINSTAAVTNYMLFSQAASGYGSVYRADDFATYNSTSNTAQINILGQSGAVLNPSTSASGLPIDNQNTASDITIKQSGARNIIHQVNGVTNLTLSTTENTSSIPFRTRFTPPAADTRHLQLIDLTSLNNMSFLPTASGSHLNPMCGAGDQQIVALGGGGIGTSVLSITPWSATTCGLRMNNVNVHIGAGGVGVSSPSSAILFNSPPNTATVSGNMSFNGDILPRTTYTAKTSSMLGYSVIYNATNTGALATATVFNNIAAGFPINIGVYFFSISIYLSKTVSGGDINLIETGISLLNSSFSGGYTAFVAGHQTYSGAATDTIVHNVTFTLPVQINTTLYFLTRATHTLSNLNNTVNSYIQVTRIA